VGLVLHVQGMSCQHCVDAVTAAVMRVPHSSNVRVGLGDGVVRVDGAPDHQAVAAAIGDIGYDVKPPASR
jgi:copper chaperone